MKDAQGSFYINNKGGIGDEISLWLIQKQRWFCSCLQRKLSSLPKKLRIMNYALMTALISTGLVYGVGKNLAINQSDTPVPALTIPPLPTIEPYPVADTLLIYTIKTCDTYEICNR